MTKPINYLVFNASEREAECLSIYAHKTMCAISGKIKGIIPIILSSTLKAAIETVFY